MPGYTSVSGTQVVDSSGAGITGLIRFFPVDGKTGKPISYQANGSGTGQRGSVVCGYVEAALSAGAFTTSLADTRLTSPVNVSFRVQVIDVRTGNQVMGPGYEAIQPFGASWSLDDCKPDLAPLALIQTGPQGPKGNDGIASLKTLATQYSRLPIGHNLFNASTVLAGHYIQGGSGSIYGDSGHGVTDFIPANAGGKMVSSVILPFDGDGGIAFFDQNGAYLTGIYVDTPAGTPFDVPVGAATLRATLRTGDVAACMIVFGPTLPSSYEAFGVVSPNLVTAQIASAVSDAPATTIKAITNLIDLNAVSSGGILLSSGQANGAGGYYATDFLPVSAGDHFTSNTQLCGDSGFGTGFYDSSKTYLPSASIGSPIAAYTPVLVPAGASFLRAYINGPAAGGYPAKDPTHWMIVQGSVCSPSFFPYRTAQSLNSSKPLGGKKWACFGDSITAVYGTPWTSQVVARTGLTQVFQDAGSGRPSWSLFENYSNDPVNGTGQNGHYYSPQVTNTWADGVQRWVAAGNTVAQDLALYAPDIILVFAGTNDSNFGVSLGSIADTPSHDGSYFAKLRWVCESFINAYPAARYFWVAPYQNVQTNSSSIPIVASIKAVCAYYGWPVLDLSQFSNVNPLTYAQFLLSDHLHPNGTGEAMLADKITAFLSSAGV